MLLVWVCGFSGLDLWRTCLGPISGHHHYESQAQSPNMQIFWDKLKRNHCKPKRRDYLLILVLLESETRSVWQRPVPVPKPEMSQMCFQDKLREFRKDLTTYPSACHQWVAPIASYINMQIRTVLKRMKAGFVALHKYKLCHKFLTFFNMAYSREARKKNNQKGSWWTHEQKEYPSQKRTAGFVFFSSKELIVIMCI